MSDRSVPAHCAALIGDPRQSTIRIIGPDDFVVGGGIHPVIMFLAACLHKQQEDRAWAENLIKEWADKCELNFIEKFGSIQ